MDWSKSKIILIIALIITNLILFSYVLSNYFMVRDETRSDKFIKETIDILNNAGIEVDAEIPKSKTKLPTMLVEFESYDKENLNKRFFDRNGKIEDPNSEFTRINFNNESLSIINTRRLIYENSINITQKKDIDFKQAEKLVEMFLIDRGFDINNMQCDYYKKEGDRIYINYSKLYNGVVIERSYCNFIIDNGVITLMDRLWIRVLDKSKNDVYIDSAPKALLRLLDMSDDLYGEKIKKIEECFYFDPEEQGYVDDITKVMQGRAIPAWKIQFDNGTNIMVDSF
jgi:hypothetical protein